MTENGRFWPSYAIPTEGPTSIRSGRSGFALVSYLRDPGGDAGRVLRRPVSAYRCLCDRLTGVRDHHRRGDRTEFPVKNVKPFASA